MDVGEEAVKPSIGGGTAEQGVKSDMLYIRTYMLGTAWVTFVYISNFLTTFQYKKTEII